VWSELIIYNSNDNGLPVPSYDTEKHQQQNKTKQQQKKTIKLT